LSYLIPEVYVKAVSDLIERDREYSHETYDVLKR